MVIRGALVSGCVILVKSLYAEQLLPREIQFLTWARIIIVVLCHCNSVSWPAWTQEASLSSGCCFLLELTCYQRSVTVVLRKLWQCMQDRSTSQYIPSHASCEILQLLSLSARATPVSLWSNEVIRTSNMHIACETKGWANLPVHFWFDEVSLWVCKYWVSMKGWDRKTYYWLESQLERSSSISVFDNKITVLLCVCQAK